MDTKEIIIVGAGPTGLTCALSLHRFGIHALVIDARPPPEFQDKYKSKALAVHARSLELLEPLGVVEEMHKRGIVWTYAANEDISGKAIVDIDTKNISSHFNYALSIPQYTTEEILQQACRERGIEIQWSTKFLSVTQHLDKCTLNVQPVVLNREHSHDYIHLEDDGEHLGESFELHARWVVACDGAHSAVRHSIGATFEGEDIPVRMYMASCRYDFAEGQPNVFVAPPRASAEEEGSGSESKKGAEKAEEDDTTAEDETLHRCLDGQAQYKSFGVTGPQGILGLLVEPNSRVRVIIDGTQDPELHEPTLEFFQQKLLERVPAHPMTLSEPHWLTRFEVRQRRIKGYRHGRIFFAGDAAHCHSPAGGQGMNTGMSDAINLSWKLALVVKGVGRTGTLIDSYGQEREPIGAALLANTSRATKAITIQNPVAIKVRNAVMSTLSSVEFLRNRILQSIGMVDVSYRASPLVCQGTGPHSGALRSLWGGSLNVQAGDRVPDGLSRPWSSLTPLTKKPRRRLYTTLRSSIGHVLLIFAGAKAGQEDLGALKALVLQAQLKGYYHSYVQACLVVPEPTVVQHLLQQAEEEGDGNQKHEMPADDDVWGFASTFSAGILVDDQRSLYSAFGVGDDAAMFLVRPDLHLAMCYHPLPLDHVVEAAGDLVNYLKTIFV